MDIEEVNINFDHPVIKVVINHIMNLVEKRLEGIETSLHVAHDRIDRVHEL